MRVLLTIFCLTMLPLSLANAASDDNTLTVYTYESFVSDWGPGPLIKKSFEAECKCTLKWVGIQDGVAILNRLKIEGPGTDADIALGLDTNLIAEARATNLFEAHQATMPALTLPISWPINKEDDIFIPYDYAHFAVIYDREQVKTPPTSLDELVNGNSDLKIVIQDPRTSSPGLGFMLWMKSVYKDKASDAWRKLQPKILTVTPGWSEAYGLFTKGEAEMVLSYTTSPAYHLIAEKSDKYAAAKFSEGHYMQVEVAGLLKSSKNKDLANQFLTFMTGPGFQDHIPTNNWMFPVGTLSSPLPKEFSKLVKPDTTLLFSPEEVSKNRRAWTGEWLEALSQ